MTSTAVATCRHHWDIESPAGPESWGVCKLCGEGRPFLNALPTHGRYETSKAIAEEGRIRAAEYKKLAPWRDDDA